MNESFQKRIGDSYLDVHTYLGHFDKKLVAILAHNLQKMAPFVDSDHSYVLQDKVRPKAMGMDGFRGDFEVPGDINIGNFDILSYELPSCSNKIKSFQLLRGSE